MESGSSYVGVDWFGQKVLVSFFPASEQEPELLAISVDDGNGVVLAGDGGLEMLLNALQALEGKARPERYARLRAEAEAK